MEATYTMILSTNECRASTFLDQPEWTTLNRTEAPWSGIGDFDVVWDWQHSRWFMLTSHMRGAVSYDKTATAASWRKWDGQDFTIRETYI